MQVHLGAPAGRINGLTVTDGGSSAVVQDGDANHKFKYGDQSHARHFSVFIFTPGYTLTTLTASNEVTHHHCTE